MGQAKFKTEKPAHYAGPRGDKYYCRNRCGTVVHYKGTNETFVERANRPLWGWCEPCSRAVIDAVKAKLAAQAEGKRCATMFRHAAHEQCDGNPDGMPDPMFVAAAKEVWEGPAA